MTEIDLFGQEIESPLPSIPGARKPTRPNGYAAPPGTGPAGETCKTCQHYCRTGGHAKHYLKCGRTRHAWTHGPGTDIKAGAPACKFWEKPND